MAMQTVGREEFYAFVTGHNLQRGDTDEVDIGETRTTFHPLNQDRCVAMRDKRDDYTMTYYIDREALCRK